MLFQNVSKRKLSKEYTIFSGREKKSVSETPSSTLSLEGWTRYFRHKHTIELYKNKMDSKVIKTQQETLQRSNAVSIEVNSQFS